MGLDMYLSAKKHISNFDFYPEEKELNGKIKDVLGLSHLDSDMSSVHASVNVGYWRKANQIHDWFVKNCQDGKDDCGEYFVPRDALIDLLATVEEALNTKNPTKLPPCKGFFFGSTEIDEWYWDDLENTASLLKRILGDEALKGFHFYYQSSW